VIPISPYPTSQIISAKNLGYTNSLGLANIVKLCLDNVQTYTNIEITFKPDPNTASSQVYQYAPLFQKRPSLLRQTQDVDLKRPFRVHGILIWNSPVREYYIQPNQPNGKPMRGNVYFALPKKYSAYEKWSGFGVIGNPQYATNMETLLKIVDNNIIHVSFFTEGKWYQVGHTRHNPKSVDQIFDSVVKNPTPAEAAAEAAKIEKARRAQQARLRESTRRSAQSRSQRGAPFSNRNDHSDLFKMFYGVGTPQETLNSKAKAKLAAKLANGEINQDTFQLAMNALGKT